MDECFDVIENNEIREKFLNENIKYWDFARERFYFDMNIAKNINKRFMYILFVCYGDIENCWDDSYGYLDDKQFRNNIFYCHLFIFDKENKCFIECLQRDIDISFPMAFGKYFYVKHSFMIQDDDNEKLYLFMDGQKRVTINV